jgi:hypothetical protein
MPPEFAQQLQQLFARLEELEVEGPTAASQALRAEFT